MSEYLNQDQEANGEKDGSLRHQVKLFKTGLIVVVVTGVFEVKVVVVVAAAVAVVVDISSGLNKS